MLIAKHFGLPPEQAWFGAGDHVEGLVVPEKFQGTEVEELTTLLRKKVIWHQPGTMDKEDARDVMFTLNRLVVAIDRTRNVGDSVTELPGDIGRSIPSVEKGCDSHSVPTRFRKAFLCIIKKYIFLKIVKKLRFLTRKICFLRLKIEHYAYMLRTPILHVKILRNFIHFLTEVLLD